MIHEQTMERKSETEQKQTYVHTDMQVMSLDKKSQIPAAECT